MNRLSSEKSPYLLQHAGNPVDWRPWGEEAFDAARREDKPVFLSVGYATCHWCHVMAHESFEDPDVAAVLNEHFIAIKVDREERPDVDRVYMAFVQATTGGGGWPMSVWLTPDGRPFYGGTYFPPAERWGKPGFRDLLLEMARLWREERGRVERAAESVAERLAAASAGGDRRGRAGRDRARLGDARFLSQLRPAERRLRRRAQVPAPVRTAVPAARAPADGRSDAARRRRAHADGDGGGRHARPDRRRLPPLLGGRAVAGAALREDALRPGAAGAGVPGGRAGDGRRRPSSTWPRTRCATCSAT